MHRNIAGRDTGTMEYHELGRIRAAAHQARRVHPGAVGELVARELSAHADFGRRFATDGLMSRLVTEILQAVPGRCDPGPPARLVGQADGARPATQIRPGTQPGGPSGAAAVHPAA